MLSWASAQQPAKRATKPGSEHARNLAHNVHQQIQLFAAHQEIVLERFVAVVHQFTYPIIVPFVEQIGGPVFKRRSSIGHLAETNREVIPYIL